MLQAGIIQPLQWADLRRQSRRWVECVLALQEIIGVLRRRDSR